MAKIVFDRTPQSKIRAVSSREKKTNTLFNQSDELID